jgi:tetratricopeptide (TPR) repeat protein
MTARTHNRLGTLLRSWGRMPEADEAFAEAERTAAPLVAEFPDRRDFRQELASILFNHGNALVNGGKAGAERALALYGRSLERFRGLSSDYRHEPNYRCAVADGLFGRGVAHGRLGRIGDGRADYEAAAREYESLQSDFPGDHRYREGELRVRLNLFDLLVRLGEHSAAAECADRLDQLAAGLRAAFPTNADPIYFQGRVTGKRAVLLDALDEAEKAVSLHEASIALLREARSMTPSPTCIATHSCKDTYSWRKRSVSWAGTRTSGGWPKTA